MNEQTPRQRLRENAKLRLRRRLGKWGIDIGRDPYPNRLVRSLVAHDVECVIDVGANVGQYGALLRAAGFPGRIISAEPLTSAFAVLSRRAAADPAWTALNIGVGAEPGEVEINISANSYSSSVLEMRSTHLDAAPDSVVIDTETIRLSTVSELVAAHGVEPERCLLKIDTQGYESHVLAGAGELLNSIAGLQLELSFLELYAGQELFDALVARARDHGLTLWAFEPGFSDRNGRMLQCDGLFMREALAASRFSNGSPQ